MVAILQQNVYQFFVRFNGQHWNPTLVQAHNKIEIQFKGSSGSVQNISASEELSFTAVNTIFCQLQKSSTFHSVTGAGDASE